MKSNIRKIVLVGMGGTGELGDRILGEALRRGHNVIALVDHASDVHFTHPSLDIIEQEAIDDPEITRKLTGNDVMISAFEPSSEREDNYINFTRSVIDIAKNFGFKKVIATGYHTTVNPDGSKKCTPSPFVHQISQAQKEARHLFEAQKKLVWSYIHASSLSSHISHHIHKGDRFLLLNRKGKKRKLAVKSYASALIDEAERRN